MIDNCLRTASCLFQNTFLIETLDSAVLFVLYACDNETQQNPRFNKLIHTANQYCANHCYISPSIFFCFRYTGRYNVIVFLNYRQGRKFINNLCEYEQ